MALYISGSGNISPKITVDSDFIQSVEPDYGEWIDVRQLRRMSRIIKLGVTAAQIALKDAGIERPDGIITGTGYGCLEDTGLFLDKMIANKEEALNPTPFMQSTHNTIGSQIALLLQCQGYNQTFTHNAFSFEHALIDATLHLLENPEQTLLVGGADELTEVSESILMRFPAKKNIEFGEGAAYFVLSTIQGKDSKSVLEAVRTFYKPIDPPEKFINTFLEDNDINGNDIDLLLYGASGDSKQDERSDQMVNSIFSDSSILSFKDICGEYPVASSFALWLASKALAEKNIPDNLLRKNSNRPVKNVLIYNQYFGTHHTVIFLRACQGTR